LVVGDFAVLRLRSKIEGRMKRFSAGSVMETRVVPHLR
jgi:hypothetical protein